jgi:hypothetical protein
MPRKKKVSLKTFSPTKAQLTIFLNTLASAWFIAGVITPATLNNTLEKLTLYRAMISIVVSGFSLLFAIRLAESQKHE